MKKSTISKLKSIFGSKKGKRQHQQQQSIKSSRTPSPEPAGEASVDNDDFRHLMRTPPPTRAGPPPSPPVPTHPVAPVAPEPSGPLPLLPCQVCGRTFVPLSLAKHVKICEKMTVKKRKTFDSSRQRREGTDLEQYLPKNFGLPENSPFLEKSPPPTAKPVPKPKVHSVRNAITKPTAELQKCPHCNRAFGVRAFERHVEWCADKAKILPAAPAQPPPHIADAKQRLNARTQYKAPPVRGRKSSQTRDKSSNSRSASVESSRGISPPREFGDYRHGRTRASESVSSNDCHEDTSPHVPVIRNSRNSQNNSSGDANIKARQARLARDLSSSRKSKDPRPSSVQQSITDPNIKKTEMQHKHKSRMDIKKQQQLKKLEAIAHKYNERNKEKQEETKAFLKKREKSLIPIPRMNTGKKGVDQNEDNQDFDDSVMVTEENQECILKTKVLTKFKDQKPERQNILKASKEQKESKTRKLKPTKKKPDTPKDNPTRDKEFKLELINKEKTPKPINKEFRKIVKESSMSLDSLENAPLDTDRKCQSIGINTELLCVPCVIHDNIEQKYSGRKPKNKHKSKELELDGAEPKIELLYKNPIIGSSCDTQSREKYEFTDSKDTFSLFNSPIVTASNSENFVSDNIDLEINISKAEDEQNDQSPNKEQSFKNKLSVGDNDNQKPDQDLKNDNFNNLSTEIIEDNYENDTSNYDNYSGEHKSDAEDNHNDIECRYGSGETYTKFTEDPADLDEFINLTDKMMINHNFEGERFEMGGVSNMHTPKTDSLEAINKDDTNVASEQPKYNFSDTFKELKINLKMLLENAGNSVNESLQEPNNTKNCNDHDNNSRKVCDMEHITVYQLKFYEQKAMSEKMAFLETKKKRPEGDSPEKLRLPSINENNKPERKSCNKKRMQRLYKPNRKYEMLSEQNRSNQDNKTFIMDPDDNSDGQSISSEAPPLKLPRIENKKTRLDDNYDPFVSAARQMKELMSSDTNIPKKMPISSKDLNRTLPVLRTTKEKTISSYNNNNTKMMKDTLNKSYQKTPTLQRMKSFGSTNNDNNNTFGGRCSSFRVNRNDNKKSSQKLNTTFTKSSKENISTMDNKSYFSRNSNLNRSFSSYTASSYSTPKPKDKIPKIATSLYHSFQRTTIKQPLKLDKIKRDDEKKNFVNLDSILADDNSSMTDSSYIDPRLINENDNLPINVNTIRNNPDIISSMESLLTTENLPSKFESFSSSNLNNNNIKNRNGIITNSNHKIDKLENNNNINKITAPIIDDLSTQYDKIMSSLEQSIASKTSVRDDESLCEDFDLEEFMTSFDEEIIKHKLENKRTCSSTTRVVKQSEIADSNRSSEKNSVSSTPKIANGMIPVNKSTSLIFSSNNIVNENLFPSTVKRSTSLLDSIQKKSGSKVEMTRSRHKTDQLEQDLMQSLKDFDKFYASEKNETSHSNRETMKYSSAAHTGTAKRDGRLKPDRKPKKDDVLNGNYTPNGKPSNDSAYSSLNRISPSKLSLYTTKENNGLPSLEQIPAGSDSSNHKDDTRYRSGDSSSEEFLAMERSAERDEPLPKQDIHPPFKEVENHAVNNHAEKRASSRASSRRSPAWRRGELSSSGSEASLHRARRDSAPAPHRDSAPAPHRDSAPAPHRDSAPAPHRDSAPAPHRDCAPTLHRDSAPAPVLRPSRFCHECGTKFSVDTAKFCIECGVKRLLI